MLGIPVTVRPASVDEAASGLPDPLLSALSIAKAKAEATAQPNDEDIVVAADTVVAFDGRQLGKPSTPAEATNMLRTLRASRHLVATGVVLLGRGGCWMSAVATGVDMRPYSDDEIDAYVERGEPFDKAGGYAIQDEGFHPVQRIDGCFLNVVGIPLCAVTRGLETLGIPPAPHIREPLLPPCVLCTTGSDALGPTDSEISPLARRRD